MADNQPGSTSTATDTFLWGEFVTGYSEPMTVAQFLQLPDDANHDELVQGRLLRMPPTQDTHGRIAGIIYGRLFVHCLIHSIEKRLRTETGYDLTLPGEKTTILAPDVSFQADIASSEGYQSIPPLLAVEVVSPTESRPKMTTKAQMYLARGVQVVWMVWPASQTIDVWQSPSPTQPAMTLAMTDTLTAPTILPGFQCMLSDIFS